MPITFAFLYHRIALGAFLFLFLGVRMGVAVPTTENITLDPEKAITQYMHDVWQIEEGLPQNTVQAIIQSQEGYLWLGTEEGLVRFNGSSFVTFDSKNTEAFNESNLVHTLFEDSKGRIWIGTNNGLIRYENNAFYRVDPAQGLTGKTIRGVAEDATGTIWIGSIDEGLFHCITDECLTYASYSSLEEANVHSMLYSSSQDTMWVGTDKGLMSFSPSAPTSLNSYEGLSDQLVLTLHKNAENNLWIGTNTGLFQLLDGVIVPGITPSSPIFNKGVWAIWQDIQGSLWLGLSQDGLVRVRNGIVETFPTGDLLASGRVRSFFKDQEGSLWIGTEGSGLHRLRDGLFSTITAKEGLSNNSVRSVLETADNSLWIGTEHGLNRWHSGNIDHYTVEEGLSDNFITSIAGKRDNNLWVGTLGGGLNHLLGTNIEQFTATDGLPSNAVFSLYQDRNNDLWIGTDAGLSVRRNGSFTNYSTNDGLPSNLITALLEDSAGTLWIGTYDAGLVRFRNNTFSTFATEEELQNNLILALHEDSDGIMWIGTYEGGLSRLRNGKITSYSIEDGLFDNVVFQILEDDQGNLWMGCNKGVFRIAKEQFDAYDQGDIQRLTSVSYDKTHGLRSREANGGSQPAGWKSTDGTLWFPTIQGVASVKPVKLTSNNSPSPIAIEKIVVDQEEISISEIKKGTLRLPPGTERVEFDFSAITFLSPQKVNYRYRLNGYESDWSDILQHSYAPYTHLDPGTYTFEVIAQNSEGVWNQESAQVAFRIEPHFYQMRLFWFAFIFGLGLLGFYGYRLRFDQLRSQKTRLEQAVNDRTHDLQLAKEEIEKQSEKLRLSLEEKEVLLREVHHRVKNNLQVITSLLSLQAIRVTDQQTKALFQECQARINSMALIHERLYQSDDLAEIDMASYLKRICLELGHTYNAEHRGIKLHVDIEEIHLGIDHAIPSGLIVNELVSNAFKHAFPDKTVGDITIEFSKTDTGYMISVSDNGKGLPQPFNMNDSTSLGMKLVSTLSQKLRGQFTIPQDGLTCFQIAFPHP